MKVGENPNEKPFDVSGKAESVRTFFNREEGMVGNRSAFATAAFVSTTALAMSLLVAPSAEAAGCDPA